MPNEMWQSILIAPKTSELQKRPIPEVKEEELLIKVKLCGVCASELKPWQLANAETEFGHEVVGEVVALGKDVKTYEVGMRVTGLIYKGFAEYTVAHQSMLTVVPEGLSDEAALGEPVSCVMSGMRRTDIDLGDRVAIIGLGYMGLLALQAALLKGSSEVIAIDTREESRQRALAYGADKVLAPDEVDAELLLERWQDIPQKRGLEVVIEAAGNEKALELAGKMVKEHGVLSIVGFHQNNSLAVDMEMWNWKALNVLNAHERRSDYQMDSMCRGLKLIEAGKIKLDPWVSHSFSLNEVDQAYSAILDKPDGFVKGAVRVSV